MLMALAMRYEQVGYCIYCGCTATAAQLTDEHIIPFSLNGEMILPKSSCSNCSTATSKIERHIAHDLYRTFRPRANLKSRRRKNRPNYVVASGRSSIHIIPESGGIAAFPIITLPPPGLIRNPPDMLATFDGSKCSFKIIPPVDKSHIERLSWDDPGFQTSVINVNNFAALCAKIGHSYAVAEFRERFTPLLGGEIVNPSKKIPVYVGGSPRILTDLNVNCALAWHAYKLKFGFFLSVDVSLFPATGQSPVTVIVGRLSPDQFEDLKQRPGANSNLPE